MQSRFALNTQSVYLMAPGEHVVHVLSAPGEHVVHVLSALEMRAESHIFLCVLAYHLLVAIETTLVRQEIHTSWATVRDLLATHEIATIVLPTDQNGVLRIRRSATPEPNHRVLYEALGVPMEIMRPVKTWERNTATESIPGDREPGQGLDSPTPPENSD